MTAATNRDTLECYLFLYDFELIGTVFDQCVNKRKF